jgi:MarR family transcriptional regulator, lower aerobic nicotinate degradation pathway regulator
MANMGATNIAHVGAPYKWYPHPVPEEVRHALGPGRIRDRPTWLVSRTYARSHQLLTDGFAASGSALRSYHYRLLAALDEWGPVSQADLARSTAVDRSDVVTVLTELEHLRLIERTVDPTNQRRNIVTITPSGTGQLRALDRVLDAIQERFLGPLSPNERRQLIKLLRKLVEAG